MAKIKKKDRYPEDVVITDNDYLIGTDADESNRTKNFPIKAIAEYIASTANADTSFIQNNKVVEIDALDGLNQQEPVISQAVNLSTNFTINGDEIFFINNQFSSRGTATTLRTYRNTYIFKKGKGNYGLNSGLELVEEDFLLIRSVLLSSVPLNGGLPPRVEYIESTDITDPSSTVNTSSDSYDILNNRDTYFVVQSFLKETPRPTIIYRFVGIVGAYGLGGTVTVEADFLLVEDLSDIKSFDPVILSNTSQLENDGADGIEPFITANDVPEVTAATTSLDTTNLTVAKEVELQAFAERVDHQLFTTAGTGVHSSYFASVAIAGTTFTIGVVQGEISSDEGYFDRHYDGASGVELVNTSAPYTYVYIDKDLVLQQQISTPTEQDWNRKIFVMRIVVDTNTNFILGFGYYSNPIGHYGNTIRTLWKYLLANGVPFRIGQEVTGSPTDLSFDIAAGTLMVYGSTGNINAPHEKEFDSVESTDFTLIYRTTIGATVNQLPKVWDSNGTITPLGSTTCVAHRIYRYSTGDVVLAIGQGNYANMVLCKAGALLEQYVLNPLLKDAVFMGWWLIEETATATSGTADAEFVEYTIGIQGGSSSGLAGALLRGNNLSDLLDVEVARTNLGLDTIGQLEKITENGKTGYALKGDNRSNKGDIGDGGAIDLSTDEFLSGEGATGYAAFAQGVSVTASGEYSKAIGVLLIASGNSSSAEGSRNTASGAGSKVMGVRNYARGRAEVSGGWWGTDYTPTDTGTDRLVNYGNGGSNETSRQDAYTLFRNGAQKFFSAALSTITNAVKGFVMLDENAVMHIHDGTTFKKVSFADELDKKNVAGTTNIDWNKTVFKFTATAATTLQDLNLPSHPKTISIYLTGEFPITVVTAWNLDLTNYDGTVWNRITVDYVEAGFYSSDLKVLS